MEKLPVLFISVCSNTKIAEDEEEEYTNQDPIINYLETMQQLTLYEKRRYNFDLLKGGRVLRGGRQIGDLEEWQDCHHHNEIME